MFRILFFLALFGICCSPRLVSVPASFEKSTFCISQNPDGSVTLSVWGAGINRDSALENAISTACQDIIFNGVYTGNKDCSLSPLISKNSQNQDLYSRLKGIISNKTEYSKYVSTLALSKNQKIQNGQIRLQATLKVDRTDIKRKY